jgi:hypothetical protein
MEIGLELRVIWGDSDALKVRVSAWNGAFGGVADTYAGIGELAAAGDLLRGFPKNSTDERCFQLGCLDRQYAGGGARLQFRCVDGAGHAFVEVMIDSNAKTAGTVQTAMVSLPIEAAAVDAFVVELEALEARRDGVAWLRGGNGAVRTWSE